MSTDDGAEEITIQNEQRERGEIFPARSLQAAGAY